MMRTRNVNTTNDLNDNQNKIIIGLGLVYWDY